MTTAAGYAYLARASFSVSLAAALVAVLVML